MPTRQPTSAMTPAPTRLFTRKLSSCSDNFLTANKVRAREEKEGERICDTYKTEEEKAIVHIRTAFCGREKYYGEDDALFNLHNRLLAAAVDRRLTKACSRPDWPCAAPAQCTVKCCDLKTNGTKYGSTSKTDFVRMENGRFGWKWKGALPHPPHLLPPLPLPVAAATTAAAAAAG